MIDDPKTYVIGAIVGSIPVSAAITFATTTWQDVGIEFVKMLGTVAGAAIALVGTIYAIKANTKAAEAKAASIEAATTMTEAANTLNSKADTAADAAQQAAKLALEASTVAVASDRKLDEVARHTNGEYTAIKAERDELQRWKEATLAASTPPGVASTIAHVAETVDAIADATGAPKSGTKMKPVVPPEGS